MKIREGSYIEGKFTIYLVDINNRPLGIFIATDFELIKSLRKNNLKKLELVFIENDLHHKKENH